MRKAVTFALVLVLMGVVAACPALACLAPGSHPCCPRHPAPAASQDCPSQVLERGKIAPVFSAVVTIAPASAMPAAPVAVSLTPADCATPAADLFLRHRSLRI